MKWVRGLLFITFTLLFLTAAVLAVLRSDLTRVRELSIQGASPAVANRLSRTLSFTLERKIWDITVQDIADKVKSDSWIESVEVQRQFPSTLLIQVVERKPFAVLGNKKGRFKLVDQDNNIIDVAKNDDLTRLPILMGKAFVEKVDLRKAGLDLLKTLPEEGILSLKDVSDVEYKEDRGFSITLMKSGITIELGKENLPLHIDRARRVVQYLDQNNINATRVDADYAKKVLVKVRKGR